MAHARIGRVRMKSGGAEVRVLHNSRKDGGGQENWCGEVVKSARIVADFSEPGSELIGFVVLGLYSDGNHSLGFRFDPKRSPIPGVLMPSYVGELIRRDMITRKVACDVVNRSNGWKED